ncbi:LysR family transcriptional regulator [Methylobacterium sp. A54F]
MEATTRPRMPDWQGLWLFLELQRAGSFRAGAERLGLSINTLRRRIDDLERELAVPLVTRHVDGIRLTPEGSEILDAAQRMEAAAFGVMRARDAAASAVAGEVRIAVTEGLGTFWLTPRLIEFQRANPRLVVDLRCTMDPADVGRLEADVAVQLVRPENPDLKVVKLGRLHLMPFAAQGYLDLYGVPSGVQDAFRHRVVLQVANQTLTLDQYERMTPGMPQAGYVALRTNVSSAHYWAVAKGAGIGWLPTYAHAIGARVVPLDGIAEFGLDIWLTYHPDAERVERVRRVIDWLRAAFDPARFPWFRDAFVHPRDLPPALRGEPLVNLFEGFTAGA